MEAELREVNQRLDIYQIEINALDGHPITLEEFKGKFLLVVNVASQCGFTPQYEGLQRLQDYYKDRLVVLGVPCNQFGQQEPGSDAEIKSFCQVNYGISFPMTEKIKVKGADKHPLYQWLTQKEHNGVKNTRVRWNFQKYLIGPDGEWLDFFYSLTRPDSKKIKNYLDK